MNNELYHYGVKGMKWGVRKDKYQKKSGSTTSISSIDAVKRLAKRDLDADRKLSKLDDDYNTRTAEIDRLYYPKVAWDASGRMTQEARDYMAKMSKVQDDYNTQANKIRQERAQEETNLRKAIFLADNVKPSVMKAKELHKTIDSLYDDTVGPKSKAYQDAWKEYSKQHGTNDEAAYGFDHYQWPRSQERKQAAAEYKEKADVLQKQYNNLVKDIGKTVTQGFGDQKISDNSWFKNYEEWGCNEVDGIIRFDRLEL